MWEGPLCPDECKALLVFSIGAQRPPPTLDQPVIASDGYVVEAGKTLASGTSAGRLLFMRAGREATSE